MPKQYSRIDPSSEVGEPLLFYAERLVELTSLRSLDSHRARAVNVPGLIVEAGDQLGLIISGQQSVSPSSADCIMDELTERLSGNIVTNAMIRPERQLVLGLRSLVGVELHESLKGLKQEVSAHAYATQIMSETVDRLCQNRKSELDFLASELVTTLVGLGMSRRHIHDTALEFFWEKERFLSSLDDLRNFYLHVFPHYHEFYVCFGASPEVRRFIKSDLRKLRVLITRSLSGRFLGSGDALQINNDDANWFVEVGPIRTLDKHSAIAEARQSLALLKNLSRMYNRVRDFTLSNDAIVQQCCVESVAFVGPEKRLLRLVDDVSDRLVSSRLSHILGSSRFMLGGKYEKFVSVVGFSGLSLDSPAPENSLINTWIALETICPSRPGQSKIESVVQGTLPCIGLRYIERLILALSEDLLIWNRRKYLGFIQRASTAEHGKAHRLLDLLTSINSKPALDSLVNELSDRPLLRYRLYTLWKLLSSKAAIIDLMAAHLRRVEWQLRRIYRARNSIVHRGAVPVHIEALVASSKDYLDQLVAMSSDISCGANGFLDFDAAFRYISMEHKAYCKALAEIDVCEPASISQVIWKRRPAVSRFEVLRAGPER